LESRHAREHLALSGLCVASRLALHAAGFRLNLVLDWMFLSDLDDLRERLVATVYYFHAYPPGMDLLTGVLLKLGGKSIGGLALGLFWTLGLLLVNCLYRLARVSGLSRKLSFGLALAFALIPQTLYFEHLYLYTMPTAALIGLAAVLFHRALRAPQFWPWFWFFLTCTAIGWIRSMFHLAWFVVLIALAVWASARPDRRTVLLASAGPLALLVALYLKNYAVVGVFGSTSAGGGNLTHVTVRRLPEAQREAWIREGRLSPFARINVYAGPAEYVKFFGKNPGPSGVGLESLDRPSVKAANYNHWSLVAVNRTRSKDALFCIGEQPLAYAAVVVGGLRQIFEPSTTWHPFDKRPGSPHAQHRQLLGGYESAYNALVHGFPIAPIGLYVFLPLALGWALLRARSLFSAQVPEARARAALLVFCVFNVVFVVTVSSLFTVGESSRYRYQVESLIWLLGAAALARGRALLRRRRARRVAARLAD
jgi:hypothetical protein